MLLQQVSLSSSASGHITNEFYLGQDKIQDNIEDALLLAFPLKEFGKITKLVDTVTYADSLETKYQALEILLDTLFLSETIRQIIKELLSDQIKLSDSNSFIITKFNLILEKLELSEQNINLAELITFASAVLAYSDMIQQVFSENVTDILQCSDLFYDKLIAYNGVLDSILFNYSFGTIGFTIVLADSIKLDETSSSSAVLKSLIEDKINFFAAFTLFNEEYIAYAVNTQSIGVSKFTNYSFNSFSYPYAASSTGIYKLDSADTDEGTAIDASIKTGIMDFGTSLHKQVPYVYLGIEENGRVLLKSTTVAHGVKKEHWYEVIAHSTALDTTRAQLGRGVKSRYWQFEVSNIEGESLTLESMEILSLILRRRL